MDQLPNLAVNIRLVFSVVYFEYLESSRGGKLSQDKTVEKEMSRLELLHGLTTFNVLFKSRMKCSRRIPLRIHLQFGKGNLVASIYHQSERLEHFETCILRDGKLEVTIERASAHDI